MDEPLTLWKTLRYGAEAAVFFLFMGLFKLLGLDAASALGGFIGRHILYHLPVVGRARENLKTAYPTMSDKDVESTLREMCDNLGRVTAEYPYLDRFAFDGPRIELSGRENGDTAFATGKGVMFISGHFANWEMMPSIAQQLGYEGAIVYRPPNNPYVDRWVSRQRCKRGPKEQVTKGAAGTRRIFTLLRKGKSICILVDQKTAEGVPAPFFGRDAMTTHAPAILALRLGALLVPASAERLDGARFRVRIHEPISFEPSGDHEKDVLALTAKINRTIEDIVRSRPSQWLWIHRRWTTPRDLKKAQALGGSGVGVEREGSSLT